MRGTHRTNRSYHAFAQAYEPFFQRELHAADSHLFQKLMNKLNGHGAFADGGGDAFDGAGADVAGGEDAGAAGLEQEGLAFQLPVR